MKIADLAKIMGKSVAEVEAMLNTQDEIKVTLTDKKEKAPNENGKIEII